MVGVAVFAISGALAAGRKSLDLVGVVVIATVTAIGGGTLRDLLLDRRPFWLDDAAYLYVIFSAALVTVVWSRRWAPPERALMAADALGLALFTISGAQIAETAHLPAIVVVIMGTMTGVAGGVIRDVLTAEIPLVMRRGRIYATASLFGAAAYLVLQAFVDRTAAALVGMACIAALRFAAILWDLTIPVFSLSGRADGDPPTA